MKRNDNQQLLLDYIDDRLDDRERKAVEAKFGEHPELRKEVEAVRRLQHGLRRTFNDAASQPMPSSAIWQRLDQHLIRQPSALSHKRHFLVTALPLGLTLLLLVTLGIWLNTRRQGLTAIGPVQRVMQVPYVFQPHIAVDPNNSDHLATVATAPSEPDCMPISVGGRCKLHLVLATSQDGGATWEERRLEEFEAFGGSVSFGPDGRLYVVGVLTRGGIFVYRLESVANDATFEYTFPTLARGVVNPWLTVDQHSGTLHVVYTGPTGGPGFDGGILLQRSSDEGETWSQPVVVAPGPVVMQGGQQVALPLENGQVMLGNDGHLAVAWLSGDALGRADGGVWIATSTDGGDTFASPQRIAETWGYTATAASAGNYHIFYESGTRQPLDLTVATSRDGGRTWSTTVVSRDVPLFFGKAPAPGVGVASDGTIDVTFYAPTQFCSDAEALSRAVVDQQGWVDPCTYHMYHTFSNDGGQTWAKPTRLNERPIEGREFVRVQGYSMPGQFIGTASADAHTYSIWVEGTQAYWTRIER